MGGAAETSRGPAMEKGEEPECWKSVPTPREQPHMVTLHSCQGLFHLPVTFLIQPYHQQKTK